jgi:hypothetical protein
MRRTRRARRFSRLFDLKDGVSCVWAPDLGDRWSLTLRLNPINVACEELSLAKKISAIVVGG